MVKNRDVAGKQARTDPAVARQAHGEGRCRIPDKQPVEVERGLQIVVNKPWAGVGVFGPEPGEVAPLAISLTGKGPACRAQAGLAGGLNAPEPTQRLVADRTLSARHRPVGVARSLNTLFECGCGYGVVDYVTPERVKRPGKSLAQIGNPQPTGLALQHA